MEDYNKRFPRIKYLLQGYFHLMWVDLNKSKGFNDPRNFRHQLDELIDSEPLQVVKEIISDLDEFHKVGLVESELERLIRQEYHAAVLAPYWGLNYAQWLVEVRDYLQAGLKKK